MASWNSPKAEIMKFQAIHRCPGGGCQHGYSGRALQSLKQMWPFCLPSGAHDVFLSSFGWSQSPQLLLLKLLPRA